jgi:hypothetical protein
VLTLTLAAEETAVSLKLIFILVKLIFLDAWLEAKRQRHTGKAP